MRLFELIKKVNVEDVEKRMVEIYPDEKDAVDGGVYENIINLLLEKTPLESDMSIVLEKVKDKDFKGNPVSYISVSGLSKKDNDCEAEKWAIEFCDWAEWLGMDIESNTLIEYSEIDIVVHCLNEMTFNGYTEERQEEVKSELEKRVSEINNGECVTIPLEEVKKCWSNFNHKFIIISDKSLF